MFHFYNHLKRQKTKGLVFWRFEGGIDMELWAKMG